VALLDRIANRDSIQEMDAARSDRYWDALACAGDDRDFGACYLFGYVIEMLLKVAYFRFIAIPPSDDLRPFLVSVGRSPRFARRGRLHNIESWAEELLEVRQRRWRPLDPSLAGALLMNTAEVAANWSEVLRYRRSIPAGDEATQLLRLADWFVDHRDALWR
jgi:hypothetical protein